MHLLSWVSKGLIPSRMDFGIQLWWAALGFLCWVLMWVPPRSLVLLGVVSLGTDGTHIFPILLLWLNGWFASHPSLTFPFKKFSYFSECTECQLTESLALQGTVAALMMALTWHSLRFECLPSQLASSFLVMWWLIWMLDWHGRWNGQPFSTSWSLLLSWDCFCPDRCRRFDISPLVTLSDVVMEMFEGEIPWLDQGVPWQFRFRCRSLSWFASAKHGCPTGCHNKRMEAFSHWWLKASASFWFMD